MDGISVSKEECDSDVIREIERRKRDRKNEK